MLQQAYIFKQYRRILYLHLLVNNDIKIYIGNMHFSNIFFLNFVMRERNKGLKSPKGF